MVVVVVGVAVAVAVVVVVVAVLHVLLNVVGVSITQYYGYNSYI